MVRFKLFRMDTAQGFRGDPEKGSDINKFDSVNKAGAVQQEGFVLFLGGQAEEFLVQGALVQDIIFQDKPSQVADFMAEGEQGPESSIVYPVEF